MRQKERDILGYYLNEILECGDGKTVMVASLIDKLSKHDTKFKEAYGDLYERYKEKQKKEQDFEEELEEVAEGIAGKNRQLSKKFYRAIKENYHDVRKKYFPDEYEELF